MYEKTYKTAFFEHDGHCFVRKNVQKGRLIAMYIGFVRKIVQKGPLKVWWALFCTKVRTKGALKLRCTSELYEITYKRPALSAESIVLYEKSYTMAFFEHDGNCFVRKIIQKGSLGVQWALFCTKDRTKGALKLRCTLDLYEKTYKTACFERGEHCFVRKIVHDGLL